MSDENEISKEALIASINDAQNGELKMASEVGTGLIRKRIRENGYARTIIPPKQVSRTDLNKMLDTEMPVIIEEAEGETFDAQVVSFDDSPDIAQYRGMKFAVTFFSINTKEYTKNIFELMTYSNDFRQITVDNSLKEVLRAEDVYFTGIADTVVGTENTGDGLAGYEQNHLIDVADPALISRAAYNATTSYIEDHDLNNGLFLMNRRSAKWFANMDRDAIGGDLAQSIFTDGVEAIQNFQVFGYRHASTIKRDLVPNYTIYQFTEPNYLGRFYILQDTTMYVKKEYDVLKFHATEKIGMAVANVAGIHRVRFE